MITTNIPTLQIHKLTEEQYEAAKLAGTLDENAIYMTPEEDMAAIYDQDGDGIVDNASKLGGQPPEYYKNVQFPIEAVSIDNGEQYEVSIPYIDELSPGLCIYVIPNVTSSRTDPGFVVNGEIGIIKRRLSDGRSSRANPTTDDFLYAGRPVHLTYDGSYWYLDEYPKTRATDLSGIVPIVNGGTGASTAAEARTNLDVYSKSDVDTAIASIPTPTFSATDDGNGNLTITLG